MHSHICSHFSFVHPCFPIRNYNFSKIFRYDVHHDWFRLFHHVMFPDHVMGILSLEIRIYWLHGVETDRNWIQTCGFKLYLCFRYTHFHASKWYSIGKISLIKFQRPYQAQYHITLTYCLQVLVSLSDMCNLWLAGKNTTTYTVVDYERIAVLEGDVIGWYSWIFIFKYKQIWIHDNCIVCTISLRLLF